MSSPVYYIQDTLTRQWVTQIFTKKDGSRNVDFGPAPGMQRWITQKGAEAAIERLRSCVTNPPGAADHLQVIMVR